MSGKMRRLRFTKLLTVAVLLVAFGTDTRARGERLAEEEIRATRIQRDLNGVTTVLLVSARPGKAVPPVGLLTKTARTFVQDGASTEYATQVVGTTLDNGRLYARILSTSSRVFYDKEPSSDPSGPYVVYPSKTPQSNDWRFGVALGDVPIKAIGKIEVSGDPKDTGTSIVGAKTGQRKNEISEVPPPTLDELLERENDVFSKRELNGEGNRFKPAKVRPAEPLPTYTVKKDYLSGNFDALDEEQPKNFRPRVPKIFRAQSKLPTRKQEAKPLETVTYHGFADFTTTVGDTVIVFSPSTAPAPPGRPATTIKGDATLRPNDGVAIEIRPTNVVPGRKKTEVSGPRKGQPPPRVVEETVDDPLLDAINGGRVENLQPSIVAEPEVESSADSTTPLLLVPELETELPKPTGLLKTVDSTTAFDGTTTHYKSLIYGTYIGTNYAQIIHTSSNVYFFPDEATVTYASDETTPEYSPTNVETDVPEHGTSGISPKVTTTTEEVTPEMNELTSPFKDTTDNVLTTLKDILENSRMGHGTTEATAQTVPTTESEINNDVLPMDPQGRSIQGGSSKNNLDSEGKKQGIPDARGVISDEERPSLATRLLPSTVYKTFTYFTTFFIPDGDDRTTTSINSREVVSSEVTHLTELILPGATLEPSTQMNSVLHTSKVEETLMTSMTSIIETSSGESDEEQTTKQDQEIELIFKTLYTTYTYLTTFFQESTSSVSSREVIETNVITQTVGPNSVSADVAGLFDRDESILISPTKVPKVDLASATSIPSRAEDGQKDTSENPPVTIAETTEGSVTTLQDRDQDLETTVEERGTTDSMTTEDDDDVTDELVTDLEPSPTPILPTKNPKDVVKTYYTTYTYFTTIFVDDETEIETRTEVFTNVVTEGIQPTAVVPVPQQIESTMIGSTTPKPEVTEKPAVPPEILAYLEAIQRQKSQEEALLLAKKVQEEVGSAETTESLGETTITEGTTELPANLEEQAVTKMMTVDSEVNLQVTPNPPIDGEVLGSMITDVLSSSSSGGEMVLDLMDKRNVVPEDQEQSESNNHEVEPAPTLLLQTSYTTFTYFTTMYKGDDSNVVSRLETMTNIVTETIRPSAVLPAESSTLPVTYFTTFTYWTTFYKGGDTLTTSREETVSNVVTPSALPTPTGVVEANVIVATVSPTTTLPSVEKSLEDEESKDASSAPSDPEKSVTEEPDAASSRDITTIRGTEKNVNGSTISPDPTTFYTTFTYFTTSYVGNETVLNSRLETVTSVVYPADIENQATGRAIGGPIPGVQVVNTNEKAPVTRTLIPSKVDDAPKTGLISTVRSSQVNDGTTTHFLTDVYGTYIDGLYAQVVESSTKLETPGLSSSATPALPTGVLSLNKGSIVDADEVTTVYFTTQQIGTLIDGLYAKVIESTSSTKINEDRKATVTLPQGHRTGLVRLIQGHMEANDTTTYYQSKVIGTSIDGRYAQIIESTSSFLAPGGGATSSITPTSVASSSLATGAPEISPSPAVIQSSLSEDPITESSSQEEEEEEEESDQSEEEDDDGESDEDGQKSKKKSRLTFSTRKRTFTPVIRPFASRNRPTFNPKRKGAQAATTITRTDITPTITATLAGKGNRFASSRGRVSSPIGPYSSTLLPSGSRRFSGRRSSSATATLASNSGYTSGSTRGRGSSRISPSSAFSAGRRGPTSIRGSSVRAGPRGSSSAYPGASSRYRPGIRPSSTLLRGQSTLRQEDQEDNANEFTATTLVTEETPYTEEEDGETVTAPLQTTTESSRRTTNPLLRFRRPLTLGNSSARPSATAKPPPPPLPANARRSGNLPKQNSPIDNRSINGRLSSKPNTPVIAARPRQSQNGLFPPRGLFNRKPEPTEEPVEVEEEFEGSEDEENFEDELLEEIADNDYEGSEHEDTKDNADRRSGKNVGPVVQIRPFTSFSRPRRFRRQASQLRSLTNRFRRPGQSPVQGKPEEKTDGEVSTSKEETSKPSASKPTSRYSARARTPSSTRPNSGPRKPSSGSGNKSSEPTEAPATEQQQHQAVKPRTRSKSSGTRSPSPRVKPSSATSSAGRQFTLREKDSSGSPRPAYKRPNSSGSRTRSSSKTESVARPRPPRLRSGSSKTQNEASSTSSRRLAPSRSSSRPSSNRNNGRRVPSQRNRGNSHEDIRESPFVQPEFDGTITVTHYVPTEVTIPVVNNGVTEQRNIVTAQPSTEILSPDQYSTVVGGDGRPLVVIVSEVTGTNLQGQTEVTRYLLHETSTTRLSHTLTTLGGRRASQSVIVPSTIYSVENVVSTIQPSLPNGNAPLANILLSQLLLGQLGQQNPLLGGLQQSQGTPTTQLNTRTTSYVTTITKHQSTVIPLTFRGKEILTTLTDSTTDVITATEFITDTVVVTPTAALPGPNLNSLLLLLQQPQQQQSNPLDPLFAAAPLLTQSNTLPGEVERRHQPADSDYKPLSYDYSDEEYESPVRLRGRKSSKSNGRKEETSVSPADSSVVTLYVSGRRPGEFSTVLSTVKVGEDATASRRRRNVDVLVQASRPPPSLHAGREAIAVLAGNEFQDSTGTLRDEHNSSEEGNSRILKSPTEKEKEGMEEEPRVRVRVPVVRNRSDGQHKYTVVRRRPLVSYTREAPFNLTPNPPRRVVVTRVRTLGPANALRVIDSSELESPSVEAGRHKVTVTRRRKIGPSSIEDTIGKGRLTRKKLLTIRPIVAPTPSLTIITSGFFTAPSSDDDEDYGSEEDLETEDPSVPTPDLEDAPNSIDNKPEETLDESGAPSKFELELPEDSTSQNEPIIITDNFFLPGSSNDEEEYEDDYDERDDVKPEDGLREEETTTSTDSVDIVDNKDAIVDVNKEPSLERPLDVSFFKVDVDPSKSTAKASNNSNSATNDPNDTIVQSTSVVAEDTTQFGDDIDMNVEDETDDYSSVTTTTTSDMPTEISTDSTSVDSMEPHTEPIDAGLELPVSEVPSDDLDVETSTHSESSSVSPEVIDVPSSVETVIPIESSRSSTNLEDIGSSSSPESSVNLDDSDVPTVIPLDSESTLDSAPTSTLNPEISSQKTVSKLTTTYTSPTPEDIEAGLADDLYLSLSRPDFPRVLPSKPIVGFESSPEPAVPGSIPLALEPSTSVYYTETVVTSTRLRTYTYVVTKQNGPETEVTSSTTVRPRVTTLTLTVPVTVTIAPTAEPSFVLPVNNPEFAVDEDAVEEEDEGRRFNLATRVMSNGVEVIVAGPTPALRWENSSPQPTLTLSDTVVMLLPRDKPHEFVTKTCTTTFTYLNTITKDGTTIVSTDQQVIANTATEERHRKPASESADVTLEASPTLRTEVFKTTYTYLTLNTDHPDAENALESSMKVIANTVTAPQHYLDMILEPSEAPRPETNTYLSTRMLEKTFTEDGRTRIETSADTVTQLIITESAPPPRPTSVATTLTALDNTDDRTTDAVKTYYITYTYFSTFLDKGSTVVHTNVATSSDVVTEKVPIKKTTTKTVSVNPTPEPIQIFATKTYLTTFTYFTTLLQAGPNGETSTTVSSRSHIVENIVTESIAPSLLDAGYMNALLTTAHHSDPVKNVVTGSTIIFFDEEDQIDPTTTVTSQKATASAELDLNEKKPESSTTVSVSPTSMSNDATLHTVGGQTTTTTSTLSSQITNGSATPTSDAVQIKRPSTSQGSSDLQVSNLLSLGSLGINSLSALGPVITAMAGLLQGKSSAVRRNDTSSTVEAQEVTTQRSPIYIPVAEFADGDIETAESQNIAAHLANLNQNYLPETRHKVAASLADGIPISPGEVITANSDVIIGKPGKMGPRPPQTFLKKDEHIGMKPPPLPPVPSIPVHPVHEVIQNYHEDSQGQQILQDHQGPQLQIISAHQVYEDHQKVPAAPSIHLTPMHPQKLHPTRVSPPKRTGAHHGIMENDPLLKPPNRPNVEQYVNPNVNINEPDWSPERYRRPWSAKDPLESSQHWLDNVANAPSDFDEFHGESSSNVKPRPKIPSSGQQKRPLWAQKDPLLPNIPVVIEASETKPSPSEPIVHHKVPHVIDRSTGQPLLVNIQPSQVANVVIPQGGTQALIFGDTNEPHISGQYFDDPSPYPEPEVGPGFVGIEKVQDLPQFYNDNDPADYMVPPLPSNNFNPSIHKQNSNSVNLPHIIPLSHSQPHFDVSGSHDESKVSVARPEKRPDIHLIQRPDNPGVLSGQGHVHTEILVHHRPETVNIRPQSIPRPSILSHVSSGHPPPPRRDYPKPQRPTDPSPPRRTEVPVPTEIPHRYIFLEKPSDSGNEVTINPGWKTDKKPAIIPLSGRPRPSVRPRPSPIRTTAGPHSHLIYVERPGGYPGRKPQYPSPQRPPLRPQGSFTPPNWSPQSSQFSQEPSKNHISNVPHNAIAENVPEESGQFGHQHYQVDLQDRPSHLYSENVNSESPTTTESQVAHINDHVPTGAVGYHNPSSDHDVKPEDTRYYTRVPTAKPEVQSFGQILPQPEKEPGNWQVNTQTEKMLIDSVAGESENIRNHLHGVEDKKTDQNDVVISINPRPVDGNVSLHVKNPYDTVGSINTVIGKPLGIEQGIAYEQNDQQPVVLNQGVPFGYHNKEAPIIQGVPFVSDYYTIRPYDTPIVQGKPFGVYNDFADIVKPYGYSQKDNKPEYEIVQGVPFGYYGNQKPSANHRPTQFGHISTSKPHERDDTIDLKPPAIIPQFGSDPDRPGRPYSRPSGPLVRPETELPVYSRPDRINTKTPDVFDVGSNLGDRIVKRPDVFDSNVDRPNLGQKVPSAYGNGQINFEYDSINKGHVRPDEGQINPDWGMNVRLSEDDQSQHSVRPEYRPEYDSQANNNGTLQDVLTNQSIVRPGHGGSFAHVESEVQNSRPEASVPVSQPEIGFTTQVHPEYPHIITKPRPRLPTPITISSGSTEPENNNGRPSIQFSLPVEATGEEKDSETQTERPPSMLVTKNTLKDKQNEETLETAYQTNFAVPDVEEDDSLNQETGTKIRPGESTKQESSIGLQKQRPPYQDMMPPPLIDISDRLKDDGDEEGLKPPPLPSDVVGLSPPPIVITTTNGPVENKFPFGTEDEAGLRPPPKFIPLEESIGIATPPPPSTSMVPPSPRPTLARPFLVELLSEDMVPPSPAVETSRPLEVATARPAVAVSGSIQIATAVATSHIPVVQDIESKIPIIHGTVDLPVVVDIPEILRPVETRKSEHVSIYTVRPFETRSVSRMSVQPTAMLTTSPTPVKLRPGQTDYIEPSRPSITQQIVKPTRLPGMIPNKFTKHSSDRPTFLEASEENALPSTRIEATESLTYLLNTNKTEKYRTTVAREEITKIRKPETTKFSRNDTRIDVDEKPTIVTRIDSSITKVTNTLIPKRESSKVKDTQDATMEMKPKEVTHYKTLTVTRTETSVLGSPPTTRTLLLTHTLTSTTVETVTETLLRPTSVVATVTSTVVQSVTKIPPYDNAADNDSIFVVMSDQKPPVSDAEEVEAEYGEEEISRDEQDPGGNEIHRVLAGGILGAPVIPLQPMDKRCMPECRASKAEICAEVDAEMRCICRPGFARMFPDRPCKPTYTYTLRVGLDRIGRNPIIYDSTLNDSASTVFKRLAGPTKEALDRTLMQSDLRDLYRGLNIAGFAPDPTTVEFHVQLSDNANENRLKEVLRKYLIGSNFSLGGTEVYATRDLDLIDARDFDECRTEEGGPHHDCSPHAACFNLAGSYQCSCKEGWADMSENPTYPGRVCSQAPLGCAGCNNKGHCVINTNGHEVCECFPWHGGQRCQVNLKVLLIALVTTGAILLGLLAVCVSLACFRRPSRRFRSGDRRAMIPRTGGDTSSEGSVTDLAIPHHVPHVLPPPPQTMAPVPPTKKPVRKISGKPRRPLRKPSIPISVSKLPGPLNDDQRDRSLTVMIPRAKYRSAPQSPQNYKPIMSTFAVDEHKLIGYLEGRSHPGNRKPSVISNKDYKEAELQIVRTPVAPSGALVSAGFQVSATVTRPIDAESTLARSCGETTVEPPTKLLRNADLQGDLGSTLARSCGETTIQAPTKLLRLDLGDTGSTLARSCGETTIQTVAKVAANRRNSSKETRDNASDGHTMAERDLGSTLRLQAQHPPLYDPDRTSDRDSNFDSL